MTQDANGNHNNVDQTDESCGWVVKIVECPAKVEELFFQILFSLHSDANIDTYG